MVFTAAAAIMGVNASPAGRLLVSIFLCGRAGRPHIRAAPAGRVAWPELPDLLKDDIVALLPDLRAFARFMEQTTVRTLFLLDILRDLLKGAGTNRIFRCGARAFRQFPEGRPVRDCRCRGFA